MNSEPAQTASFRHRLHLLTSIEDKSSRAGTVSEKADSTALEKPQSAQQIAELTPVDPSNSVSSHIVHIPHVVILILFLTAVCMLSSFFFFLEHGRDQFEYKRLSAGREEVSK